MRTAKPHGAGYRLERGEVNLARGCRGKDSLDVALGDPSARHDDDALARALYQFSHERQPFEHARLLARGQHPVDAELDQRFERPERLRRDVERPVKGDRERPGERDQLARSGHVDFPRRVQEADDHAVRALIFDRLDVRSHRLEFIVIEQEVAAARPDHHVEANARNLPRLTDHAATGRYASLEEIGA